MWRQAVAAFALIGAAGAAPALDFRSVDVPAAILYDSPSQQGKKLYLIRDQSGGAIPMKILEERPTEDAEDLPIPSTLDRPRVRLSLVLGTVASRKDRNGATMLPILREAFGLSRRSS